MIATDDQDMSSEPRSAFFVLVHQILVKEKLYPVREIAARFGMSYAAFYARVSGRGAFSPEEINRLIRLVPDARLVDWLLSNSSFIAAPRPDEIGADLGTSAMEHAVRSVERGLVIIKELSEAAAGSHLDEDRRERIKVQIEEIQRGLATLSAALPYLCANPTRVRDRLATI